MIGLYGSVFIGALYDSDGGSFDPVSVLMLMWTWSMTDLDTGT